jgi:hypothetical protein
MTATQNIKISAVIVEELYNVKQSTRSRSLARVRAYTGLNT